LERFSALLKARFRVQATPSAQVELELAEANGIPSRVRAGGPAGATRAEGFSLIFTGPASPLLPQGMYRFEQERLGRFDLFIVPLGRDDNTAQYEAVFNRLIPAPPA
jgi:hypothetical protein